MSLTINPARSFPVSCPEGGGQQPFRASLIAAHAAQMMLRAAAAAQVAFATVEAVTMAATIIVNNTPVTAATDAVSRAVIQDKAPSVDKTAVDAKKAVIELLSAQDRIDKELEELDKMLKTDMEHHLILERILTIVTLMLNTTSAIARRYCLDQEPELHAQVRKIQETYNTRAALSIAIASGLITIVSGIAGVGAAGKQLLVGGDLKRVIELASAGGSLGQGFAVFGKISDNVNESARASCMYGKDEIQRKRAEGAESRRDLRNQMQNTMNQIRTNRQEMHSAMQIFLNAQQ